MKSKYKVKLNRYLGITVDSNLSWQQQMDQLCKKLCSGIYIISQIRQSSNLDAAKTAHYALFDCIPGMA